MALEVGSRLGHYDVTALIGEGGMGQVYQATDTKLKRQVALKILPEAFSADPERLARFQREAEVLASLNHPNIAAIYGLEEADDTRALVLELVEGPTLADRIKQGPIPLDEALPIAKQIAEALEAAHEAGVIHRDLKPANIKVRDDGTVKVLDFGLAKALDPHPEGDPSQSPTLTAAATQMGLIMGTAAYMSPEQARGKTVDKRTDIWAFGCVLYEMLTARRPFQGRDVSETLATVIMKTPEWSVLPADTPAQISYLLHRCLERESKNRLRDIGDARVELRAGDLGPGSAATSPAPVAETAGWQRPFPLAVGALIVGGILTGIAVWTATRAAPAAPNVTRSAITLPPGVAVDRPLHYRMALAPTGTHLVYAGGDQLYLRAMDEIDATPIPRTAGAIEPFFSPDGEWIGFWADGQLKKVSATGGVPVTLCETSEYYGASWSQDDTIFFSTPYEGISRVPGSGGTPELIVPVKSDEIALPRPQLLPGGEWLLFWVAPGVQVAAQSLITGERHVLIEDGGDVRYLPTGHLAYAMDGTLLAVPFDAQRRTITGGPVALVEGVSQAGFGFAQFDHADDGTLVYQRDGTQAGLRTLAWADRHSNTAELAPLETREYEAPRLSADGMRLAIAVNDDNSDVWVSELSLGTLGRLTTHPGFDGHPLWTTDGQRVVFTSRREGSLGLYSMAWDGTGAVEHLVAIEDARSLRASSWSPNDVLLFEYVAAPSTSRDIGMLHANGKGTWEPLLATEASESAPSVSPDGKWVAYASDRTGPREIYVERFPNLGSSQLISRGGGDFPVWSRNGRELFYLSLEGRIVVIPIEFEPNLRLGAAETLVDTGMDSSSADAVRDWDVSPDGQRLLLLTPPSPITTDPSGQPQIILVENWFEELKERMPAN